VTSSAEEQLAQFVCALEPAALPLAVHERVRLHVLDAIACALAGVHSEHSAEVARVAEALFGPGSSTVIGGASASPGAAVLINGFRIAAPTLGDVHRATLTHVMPEVLPAAFAMAEMTSASGSSFVAGIAAGMEVAVRVAEALDTDDYRSRAFHNPGIAGAVGAACGAARTARLDDGAVRVAMGHAVSQAGGTFAALGTDGVKVHQARGGLSGFVSVSLAAAGVSASREALSAERGGLLAAYAHGGRPERLTDGLGTDWRLMDVALRRWPGASSLQPVIEAILRIREQAADVDMVRVGLPPRAYALNADSGWDTRLAALQSARWTVAVALADGEVWLEQADEERLLDQDVGGFARQSVFVEEDGSLSVTGARVTARMADGDEATVLVDVPPGDPRRPLTREEIVEKLRRAASGSGLGDRLVGIVEAVESLESAESVASLARLLEVA
jgi:2-methylcitrate dehydratase PrpD